MSTYWYCASVYAWEFPVAGSITVRVTVFGDRFSRYTCVEDEELDDEEEELLFCELDDDEEELCEPDEEELDELLLCEPDEEELLFCELDDICCSICCGEEYSTLKLLS